MTRCSANYSLSDYNIFFYSYRTVTGKDWNKRVFTHSTKFVLFFTKNDLLPIKLQTNSADTTNNDCVIKMKSGKFCGRSALHLCFFCLFVYMTSTTYFK